VQESLYCAAPEIPAYAGMTILKSHIEFNISPQAKSRGYSITYITAE
jgi:hypothetical protein